MSDPAKYTINKIIMSHVIYHATDNPGAELYSLGYEVFCIDQDLKTIRNENIRPDLILINQSTNYVIVIDAKSGSFFKDKQIKKYRKLDCSRIFPNSKSIILEIVILVAPRNKDKVIRRLEKKKLGDVKVWLVDYENYILKKVYGTEHFDNALEKKVHQGFRLTRFHPVNLVPLLADDNCIDAVRKLFEELQNRAKIAFYAKHIDVFTFDINDALDAVNRILSVERIEKFLKIGIHCNLCEKIEGGKYRLLVRNNPSSMRAYMKRLYGDCIERICRGLEIPEEDKLMKLEDFF